MTYLKNYEKLVAVETLNGWIESLKLMVTVKQITYYLILVRKIKF